jgi:hypothetical protein
MRIRIALTALAAALGLPKPPGDNPTADTDVARLDDLGNPLPDDGGQQDHGPPPPPFPPMGLSLDGTIVNLRVDLESAVSRSQIKDPQGHVVGEIRHYNVRDGAGNIVPCNATFNSGGGFTSIAIAEPDAP